MSDEQKWQYRVKWWNSYDWPLLEQTMNDLGREGWEVAGTLGETVLFKRPLREQLEEE